MGCPVIILKNLDLMKVLKMYYSVILILDPFGGNSDGDWMHINSISAIGPNKFYDQGDERFHPENIIWDARESNIIAIIG